MIGYFPEVRTPTETSKVTRSLQESKLVGSTKPMYLHEVLPIVTTEQPIITRSTWSSSVIELDFTSLTNTMKDYERDFGFSTIEMFHRYMNGEFSDDLLIDDWVNTFILYLGTNQIRQYSSA